MTLKGDTTRAYNVCRTSVELLAVPVHYMGILEQHALAKTVAIALLVTYLFVTYVHHSIKT